MELVLQAAAFAAEKHRNQRRKDSEHRPTSITRIQLAYILVQADIEDPVVLAAALLHDTIEDTQTTLDEIEIVFGHEIANIVAECSDDKRLSKLERKQAQIDHAAHISRKAKLVKLADKIANVSDINGAPPAGWSLERKREYFDWAKQVVDQHARHARGAGSTLRRGIREAALMSRTSISPRGLSAMTPVVRILIVANVGVFLLQQIAADALFTHFALWPLGEYFVRGLGPRRLRALAARHLGLPARPRSFAHIALNMFALYSFGAMVERARRVAALRLAVLSPRCSPASLVQLLVVTATR